jgi:nicotinamide riboside kinase
MLINIVGTCHSGKTTLAAKLFTKLKEDGFETEFISEQAKTHIVNVRRRDNLSVGQKIYLDDVDQLEIMKKQVYIEETFVKFSSKYAFIVSDSSPVNTLLYMSPECRNTKDVQLYIQRNIDLKPLVFYVKKTPGVYHKDSNRIHDEEFSAKAELELPKLLVEFAPELDIHFLQGGIKDKYTKALTTVLNKVDVEF